MVLLPPYPPSFCCSDFAGKMLGFGLPDCWPKFLARAREQSPEHEQFLLEQQDLLLGPVHSSCSQMPVRSLAQSMLQQQFLTHSLVPYSAHWSKSLFLAPARYLPCWSIKHRPSPYLTAPAPTPTHQHLLLLTSTYSYSLAPTPTHQHLLLLLDPLSQDCSTTASVARHAMGPLTLATPPRTPVLGELSVGVRSSFSSRDRAQYSRTKSQNPKPWHLLSSEAFDS